MVSVEQGSALALTLHSLLPTFPERLQESQVASHLGWSQVPSGWSLVPCEWSFNLESPWGAAPGPSVGLCLSAPSCPALQDPGLSNGGPSNWGLCSTHTTGGR